MIVERSLSPNCSEAVFRFYTVKPQEARRVLQAFANEVAHASHAAPEVICPIGRMEDVEKVSFTACAGLGSGVTECHWEPDSKAFVLCIGNNAIAAGGEGCRTVQELGINVEEAETNLSLARRWARDCTCGIRFFPDPLGFTG